MKIYDSTLFCPRTCRANDLYKAGRLHFAERQSGIISISLLLLLLAHTFMYVRVEKSVASNSITLDPGLNRRLTDPGSLAFPFSSASQSQLQSIRTDSCNSLAAFNFTEQTPLFGND